MKFYLKNRNGRFDAVGEYDEVDKSFVVLKGSLVSDDISSAPTFKGANAVIERRAEFVVNCRVVKDVAFKSPSTAANFVTGRSSDGCSLWKDETGRSFKEVIRGN